MSYELLEAEDSIHSVHHDLESFYWVLLWIILRHTKHDCKTTDDEPNPCSSVFKFGDDNAAANLKRGWLAKSPSIFLTIEGNKPLTDLMHAFRILIFRTSVTSLFFGQREYLTHAAVLEIFDKALDRKSEWPDPAEDGPQLFVWSKPAVPRLDQPKRDAQDPEGTRKQSRKQSKKSHGTTAGDDPFESTPNPRSNARRGSGRGSRARAGGSKGHGSRK